jgi:hypothetical protein
MLGTQPVCCFTRHVVLRNSIYGIKSGFAFEWTAKLLSGKRIVLSWECCQSEHINVLDCLRKLVVSVLMLVNPSSEIIRKRLTGVLSYKSTSYKRGSNAVVDRTTISHAQGYEIDSGHSYIFSSITRKRFAYNGFHFHRQVTWSCQNIFYAQKNLSLVVQLLKILIEFHY